MGAAVGWGRGALLTALAGALVAAADASGPRRLAVRLAVLASVAGFVSIVLAAITTGHAWWAAITMGLVALSALAAAGPVRLALGTLAYSLAAALSLLKDLTVGVSDPAIALRVAVGCAVGIAVAFLAGVVRDLLRHGPDDPPVVPAPWRAMWRSLAAFDEHARDGAPGTRSGRGPPTACGTR